MISILSCLQCSFHSIGRLKYSHTYLECRVSTFLPYAKATPSAAYSVHLQKQSYQQICLSPNDSPPSELNLPSVSLHTPTANYPINLVHIESKPRPSQLIKTPNLPLNQPIHISIQTKENRTTKPKEKTQCWHDHPLPSHSFSKLTNEKQTYIDKPLTLAPTYIDISTSNDLDK